ncbi:MAG: diacylglycerol/polyprenol kinase family protein [Cyanophyceae cyanobacterium]
MTELFSLFFNPSPLWFSLSLVFLYLGSLILLAETLNRLTAADAELTRKVVHIGTGNVILLAWWLQIPAWVGIGAAVMASATALLSYFVPILPSINSVGRQSLGTFFYAVSIGILVAWFWSIHRPEYAAIGILTMTWGDGMAAVVGQRFGKHLYHVLGITKSWEGSLTMAAVSLLVTGVILVAVDQPLGTVSTVSLAVAVIATGLEAFSKLGIDNLTVPLGSAAASFILCQLC